MQFPKVAVPYIFVFSVLLLSSLVLASPSATAQPIMGPNQRAYHCMKKDSGVAGREPNRIVVPVESFEAMSDKGFVEFECEREGFPFPRQVEFQTMVCTIAATEPEGMQRQFENILGDRPAVLCGMAQAALGEWVKPRGLNR